MHALCEGNFCLTLAWTQPFFEQECCLLSYAHVCSMCAAVCSRMLALCCRIINDAKASGGRGGATADAYDKLLVEQQAAGKTKVEVIAYLELLQGNQQPALLITRDAQVLSMSQIHIENVANTRTCTMTKWQRKCVAMILHNRSSNWRPAFIQTETSTDCP